MVKSQNIEQLADTSRVWIYQSDRVLSNDDKATISEDLEQFVMSWTAHDRSLKAAYEIRHNRFVLFYVDESMTGASGCSIDKSVGVVTDLGSRLGIDFFNRMSFAYWANDDVHVVDSGTFAELYQNKVITDDTLVFDNLVQTKSALQSIWKKKLSESWHARFV